MLKDIKCTTGICNIENNTVPLRLHLFGNAIFVIMENNYEL